MRLIDADELIEFCAERWIPLNIDAVNMQPTIQPVATDTNVGSCSEIPNSSDAVSRQAAIDGKIIIQRTNGVEIYYDEAVPVGYLKRLPPAQPEPKEGHWIKHIDPFGGEQYECSECGVLWEFNDGSPEDNEAFYCPKCGSYNGGGRK